MKSPLPEAIADDGDQGRICLVVFSFQHRAADNRPDSEDIEEIRRNQLSLRPHDFRLAGDPRVEMLPASPGQNRNRTSQLILNHPVERIAATTMLSTPIENIHRLKLLWLLDSQRLQQDRVDQAEDRGIGANPERQREQRDGGESAIRPKRSQSVANVLANRFQPRPDPRLSAGFENPRRISERGATGLLQMEAHLLFELPLHLAAIPESLQAPEQRFHAGSITRVIAPMARWNAASSAVNCFRPAGVRR